MTVIFFVSSLVFQIIFNGYVNSTEGTGVRVCVCVCVCANELISRKQIFIIVVFVLPFITQVFAPNIYWLLLFVLVTIFVDQARSSSSEWSTPSPGKFVT
jgi:hypothetical protein